MSLSGGKRNRRLAIPVVIVVLALVGGACGRSSKSGSSSGTTAAPAASAGSFGTLKDVCGPGNAKGATARGVTDTAIDISTMGDPANTSRPGLGQELFDVANAFVKWCNAAGGINGRKIVLHTRDAKLFETGARFVEACQTDFMSVGGGNGLDEAGIAPRLGCGLGQIPAFTASVKAAAAGLQVLPVPNPPNRMLIGEFLAAERMFPGIKAKTAIVTEDNATGKTSGEKTIDGLTAAGFTVIPTALGSTQVDNWRPFIEEFRSKGVELLGALVVANMTAMVQAMNDIGWAPKAMVGTSFLYGNDVLQAAKAATFPPTYVAVQFTPFELANENPAAKQLQDLVKTVVPNPVFVGFHMSAMNAWLLWATSAKACGSNLTVDCVLSEAKKQTKWTAGGLYPPVDLSPATPEPTPCMAIMKLTPQGYVYDKTWTKPDNGIFNCNPANMAKLSKAYT